MNVKPVMFPPGWAKPATKPCPTGSLTRLNTTGMVVAALKDAPFGLARSALAGMPSDPQPKVRAPTEV